MADRLQTEPLGWGWFFTPPNFNSDGLSVDLPHATCLLSLSLLLGDTTPAVASHACIVPVEHGEQWPNCTQEFLKPLANGVFICFNHYKSQVARCGYEYLLSLAQPFRSTTPQVPLVRAELSQVREGKQSTANSSFNLTHWDLI
jgi:hypothetical protein